MRLKKLTIHNIASIADASIDFDGEVLSSEPIFLICGETGAGKTMILDSICLALYNDTPRLKQASRSETYTEGDGTSITLSNPVQYMRKGTVEAWVWLDFESGGNQFTARWSVARARRRVDGNIQPVRWELEDHANKVFLKGAETESVIGLSFDEFRRTVMLAQGDFTAFLKSKDDEKSRILEKITGTGIYREIGKRISENFRQVGMDLALKQEAAGNAKENLLDEEAERSLEQEAVMLGRKAETLRGMRDSLEKLRNSWNQKIEAQKEYRLHQKALEDAESEFSRLSGGLSFAEDVQKADLVRLKSVRESIAGKAAHESMYRNCALIIKDLQGLLSGRNTIAAKNVEIESLNAEAMRRKSELEALTAIVGADEAACKDVREKIQDTSTRREAIGEAKMRMAKEILDRIAFLEENVTALTASATQAARDAADSKAKEGTLSAASDAAQKHYDATRELYDRMKETNEQWAKDARASLRVGDICPVCGQEIPSQEYLDGISDEHFRSLLAPVQEELDKARKEKDERFREMTTNKSATDTLERLAARRNEELAEARRKLEESLKRKEDEGFADLSAEKVREAISEAESLTRELEGLNRKFSEISSKVVTGKESAGRISSSLEAIKARIAAASDAVLQTGRQTEEILESLGGRITIEGWRDAWEADPEGFAGRLSEQARIYMKETEEAAMLDTRTDKVSQTVGLMASIRDSIIAKDGRFKDLPEGKREKVADQPALWTALNERVASAVAGLSSARERIATFGKEIEEAESALSSRFSEDGMFPEGMSSAWESMSGPERASGVLGSVSEGISGIDRELGSMKRQLDTNRTNRMRYAKDLEELDRLKEMYDRWKALNDVFGKKDGEYFQKIAQGFIMNDILSRANHYLKDMTKRYLLESQPGSLGITIRDMEQGGAVRSTSTISGGESFIISLALALGLSSLSAGGNVSSDILFIDEGFGTLSGECLDTVTETLQKLNEKGGKKVGIISHVKELSERIGAKITVTKTSPTESTVTISH
ncbi:MAG: AAA family ATPase [Candidatus Cryptobacteroides sp.]